MRNSFAVRYLIENFSPASLKTTFTWTTDTRTQTLQWDPTFFATISELYGALQPSSPWTAFEINYRQTLDNDNSAFLFHLLMPCSPGWNASDDRLPEQLIENAEEMELTQEDNEHGLDYGISDIYKALELCQFLRIEANDYIVKNVLTTNGESKISIILQIVVPYHQLFLRVQYQHGIQWCEKIFMDLFFKAIIIRVVSADEKLVYIENLNDLYVCKVQAYAQFAQHSRHLSITTKNFLRETLGWEGQVERFGIWISLTDNQFVAQ